jgi:hypothetical protein
MPPGTNKPRCQCSCSCDQRLYFPGTTSPLSARVLLSNLPFYFRVRIGPEALQLSPPFVLYVPGLMQARRLRLNHRHRQLSTRCTGNQEQTIRCWRDGSVFAGLSQADSSLESLAAIPALDYEQCNFRGSRSAAELKSKLSEVKKSCGSVVLVFSSGHRIYSCVQPFDLFFPGQCTRNSMFTLIR